MKITLLTVDLTKTLNIANRFVSHKGQLPILANILITATTTGITLSATNLEVGVRINLPGKVTKSGQITTPARSFTEFVATIGDTQVEIELVESKLKVVSGKFKADFPTIAGTEFPILPQIDDRSKISLSVELISQLALQVAFAAALDESRPVLTGIKIIETDSTLVAVGTDGFRLSKKVLVDTKKSKMPTDMIIPARTILELSRVLSDAPETDLALVNLTENNQVVFVTKRIELFSRVLEGNFPDVEKIIPKSFINEVVVDKSEFVRALRVAAIFARENNNIVRFKIQESRFMIQALAASAGETSLELEADTVGEGEVAFNYKYVTDFLASVTTDRVVMKFNEATTPVLFAPEKDDSYLHIIMPIRI